MGSSSDPGAGTRTIDRPLTGEQARAIESDAPRICVMAGPGSGKTRVLVERVTRRVMDRRLDLARTLAITFTENAAAEMKARLAQVFEERGLEEQRRRLERAYISTIHGFCARLLREHAVEARVDPDFDVLDEVHSGVLQQAILESVLDEKHRGSPKQFLEFVRHFNTRDYDRLLLNGYDTVRGLGCDPGDKGELLPTVEAAPAPSKDAKKKLPAPPHTALELLGAAQREAVADVLVELHRAYSERKRQLSALDFDDLEQLTQQMLRDTPGLARRISRRFQEILVDEYQDTSPVQSRIIQFLAAETRLFVVGDPAQSIYGFRNADPKAFQELWEEASPVGGQVDLREDFRSRPEILKALNCHFEKKFSETHTPFSPLKAGSRFARKAQPSVEILLVGTETGGVKETRPYEARRLAHRIRELIESKALRATNEESGDCGRLLGYGGVAMLFRSASDIKIYERALEEAGVPYFSETGRGFYDAREVRDVVSFLRVLDNSRNEIALAATLRSPMFGISDDALYLLADYAHREKGRVLADLLDDHADAAAPDLPAEDAGRLREFGDLLARLRAERPWRSLAELVREIVRATEYETTLLLEPGGRRKVANLRKLADVAASLESAGFTTLNDFVTAVDRFHFEEVRESEAQLDSTGEDAVRLLTMHAAKGLEFPVVVLPDLTRGPAHDQDSLDFLPGSGLGVKVNLDGRMEKTSELESIRAKVKQREEAESHRVLFVAMTRAREHLILSGCLARSGEGFGVRGALKRICESYRLPAKLTELDGQWHTRTIGAGEAGFRVAVLATEEELGAASPFQAPIARRDHPALAAGDALNVPYDRQAEAEARRLVAQALAPRPEGDHTDFLAAVTDILEFHRCPRRYYLGRYLGHDRPSGSFVRVEEILETEEETPSDEFPRTELGLAVHRVLAGGAGVLPTVPAALRGEAERLARQFWQSEYGRRAAAGAIAQENVRRELPLLAAVDGRFLRGTLDLLTLDQGRPDLLLDYKANNIPADGVETEAAHYRVQMLLYALLVEAAFGALPQEAVLFFLVPGVAHRVEFTPAALDEARGVLARFFTAQKERSFPPVVAEHCFSCAFNGTLCLAPQRGKE